MTFFLISLLIGVLAAVVGRQGVQQTGNYENVWGAFMIWSIPIALVIGVFFGFIV